MLNRRDFERAIERALDPASPDCEAAHRLLEQAARAPHLSEVLDLPFLFEELGYCYGNNRRWSKAIAAMERAQELGWKGGVPDIRALIAGLHLQAGHADEARRLYAEVRRDTPRDIWLYNAAGIEYREAGDFETAMEWLTAGLHLALETGDPEDLVPQLSGTRRACLTALGRDLDALEQEVNEFLAGRRLESQEDDADIVAVLAWFPRNEYDRALELWPDEMERWHDVSHEEYCRRFEKMLRDYRRHVPIRQVAPLVIDHYLRWCESKNYTPSEASSRAAYAADMARTGDCIVWPPGRNDPCWCNSGRKYKKCCGRV